VIDGVDSTASFSVGSSYATLSPVLTGGQHVITASIKTTGGTLLQTSSNFIVYSFLALPQAIPASGPAPLTVNFVTNALYTGGAITEYKWDFNGSGTWDSDDLGPQNYAHTYSTPGVRNAVLQVTNDKGQTASATVQISVTGAPPAVVGSVTPSDGAAPLTAKFAATATASSGTIAKYEWDFNGDGIYEFTSTTTASTTYTYNTQGTYTAVLRVTDNQGLITIFSGGSTTVRVGPAGSPTATITSPNGLFPQTPPATVYFDGYGTSLNGTIVKYEWDFNGDGTYEYSSNSSAFTSYAYNSAGTYTASLRVTDSKGLTGIASVDVVIAGALISLSTDTLLPQQNGTVDVQTSLSRPASATVFMKNQSGKTVRTLVSNVQRAVGQYKDTWDGKDDNGNIVPDGVYYAIFQYTANSQTQTVDLTNTTGGDQITFDYSWTQNWTLTTVDGTNCWSYSSCTISPYANDFMKFSFPLKQAAIMTAAIRLTYGTTQVASLFTSMPLGQGPHVIYWEGTDEQGNVIAPPPNDYFSPNIGGFTLPQNAVVVEQAPQISSVAANPNYLDPFTGSFLSGTGQPTTISFTLSKQATVVLQVASVDSGGLLRTITQPNVAAGNSTIAWDGRADNGLFAAQGSYRLALKAVDAQGNQSIIRYVLVKVFY
jgi:PKD repeat protein